MALAGYYLGTIAFVTDHIELILLGIVSLWITQIGVETLRHRRASAGF